MAGVQKIDMNTIPQATLGDLQTLVSTNNKEYVVIGTNYYALYPTPAIQLLGVIGEFIETIEVVRKEKIEVLKKEKENLEKEGKTVPWAHLDLDTVVGVTFQDVLTNATGLARVKEILTKVLAGVDEMDFNDMSLGQLSLVMSKLVSVNLSTLPDSFRKVFEGAAEQMTGFKLSPQNQELTDETDEVDSEGNP